MPQPYRLQQYLMPIAVGVTSASAALALGQVGGASAAPARPEAPASAKNVILFVGDGMGAAARTAGQYRYAGLFGKLAMDDMPYAASVKTAPRDPEDIVTDSAAAATALATGVKTFNGAIAVDVNGRPVRTFGERAKSAGKALGLVTTAQVTDATGAAFAAHVTDRSQQDEIARQYRRGAHPAGRP